MFKNGNLKPIEAALKSLCGLLCLWLVTTSNAFAVIEIEITQGGESAIPIAVVPFGWNGGGQKPEEIAAIVSSDLQRSGNFSPLNKADFVGSPVSGDTPRYGNWRVAGAEFLLIGSIRKKSNNYEVDFQLFDLSQQSLLKGLKFQVTDQSLRTAAHQIADEVYEEILGIRGSFNTQVAFVSVEGDGYKKNYKLQLSDADGFNPRSMLASPRPILSPSWAPDGVRIAYVSFEDRNQSAIYVQDRQKGSREKVVSKPGINGAPSWSPDGRRLAVTLSFEGNPDIYIVDVESGQTRQVTKSPAIDTEAVWVDDQTLIFTSDRSGGPQLYEVPVSGGRATRITFEGNYNASPSVSSDGQSVALVHGGDIGYQIAVLDRESGFFQTLTEGSLDESPSFSPNGQMIIYAKESGGRGTLGAVSLDGSVVQSLSLDTGGVREPTWSPFNNN